LSIGHPAVVVESAKARLPSASADLIEALACAFPGVEIGVEAEAADGGKDPDTAVVGHPGGAPVNQGAVGTRDGLSLRCP
jgi:hypothetical protein